MSLKRLKIRGKYYWAYRDEKGRFLATFKAKNKLKAKEKVKFYQKNVKISLLSKKTGTESVKRYDKKLSRRAGTYQYFYEAFYKGKVIHSVSSQHPNSYPMDKSSSEAAHNFYLALSRAESGEGNSSIDEGKYIYKHLKKIRSGIRYFR